LTIVKFTGLTYSLPVTT